MTSDEDSFVIIRYRSVDERRHRRNGAKRSARERGSENEELCGSSELREAVCAGAGSASDVTGDVTIDAVGASTCGSGSVTVSRCDVRCDSRESRCCSICGSAATSCSAGDRCGVAIDAMCGHCADGRGDGDMEDIPTLAHPAMPRIDTAFQSISQTVSKMQISMQSMNMDMEKTDEAVRGVTHRLRQQGQIVQQLHKAMTVLERKACQLVTSATSTTSFQPCQPPSKMYPSLAEEEEIDFIRENFSRHRSRTCSESRSGNRPGNRSGNRSRARSRTHSLSPAASCSDCSFTSTLSPSPPPCSPAPSLLKVSSCPRCAVPRLFRKRSPVRRAASKSPARSASKSPTRSTSCAGKQRKSRRSKSPKPRAASPKSHPPPAEPKEPTPSASAIRLARRASALGKKLLKAAEKGNVNRLKLLLSAGADVNFCAPGRWSALHKAAAEAHSKVVALLLKKGADPNARTTYGFTALHMAAYNDPSGRCVKHLIKAHADLDVWNRSGRTPLHHAAESGNVAAVKALMKAGASKYVKNNDGRTPFHVTKSVRVRRHLLSSARKRKKNRP